ncbi:MAG TPA: hypothetical protein VFZ98_05885, partial [Vicinamibacterales bacterium]
AALGAVRRIVAADLFYRPGGATERSIHELYAAIDLDPAPATSGETTHVSEPASTPEQASCRP